MNEVVIPESIASAPLPEYIQDRYSSVHAWLCRLSVIAGENKRHPWCTDMSYIVHMALKSTVDACNCYILCNRIHSVCVYKDVVIDVNENLYVSDFDWRVQTIPKHYVSIVPGRPDRMHPESRVRHYYSSSATSAFRLVGQPLRAL